MLCPSIALEYRTSDSAYISVLSAISNVTKYVTTVGKGYAVH